jgi:hypothetical protein
MAAEPTPTKLDTLTRFVAEALAGRLDKFWHDSGCPLAHHWTEKVLARRPKKSGEGDVGTELWVVRSNLVDGLPPRERGKSNSTTTREK